MARASNPRGSAPRDEAGLTGVPALWSELQEHLERRVRRLNEEISRYPTPIARCDEQLAALLETRAALFGRLQRMDELAAAVRAIGAFLDSPAEGADEAEQVLRSRLSDELSKLETP
jgi:hypothetical protein